MTEEYVGICLETEYVEITLSVHLSLMVKRESPGYFFQLPRLVTGALSALCNMKQKITLEDSCLSYLLVRVNPCSRSKEPLNL